jgi:hypothetical protein
VGLETDNHYNTKDLIAIKVAWTTKKDASKATTIWTVNITSRKNNNGKLRKITVSKEKSHTVCQYSKKNRSGRQSITIITLRSLRGNTHSTTRRCYSHPFNLLNAFVCSATLCPYSTLIIALVCDDTHTAVVVTISILSTPRLPHPPSTLLHCTTPY